MSKHFNNCLVGLHLLLLIHSTSSFVLLQNGIVQQNDDQDQPIPVAETINETSCCFSQVGLNQECELDEQCSSKTPNSFCALLDNYQQNDLHQDIRPVCLCRDGFNPSMSNLHCVSVQYCTYTGFNSAMEQMDCPQSNQFCREGVCLCIPNHDLDHTGQCIPIRSNVSLPETLLKITTKEPNNLSDQIVNKLASWLENILLSKRTNVCKCCVLFLLLEHLIGLALFLLGQIIWSFYLE